MKVTATTSIGKSTYREGLIQVNPLADDPWATEIGFERIITTGAKAQLYGNNLDKVNSIVIGGKQQPISLTQKTEKTATSNMPFRKDWQTEPIGLFL